MVLPIFVSPIRNMITRLKKKILESLEKLFEQQIPESLIQLGETRKEFEGDYTLICFPLLKISRKNPEQTGELIGSFLTETLEEVVAFNVIKGFLNLSLSDECWQQFLAEICTVDDFGSGIDKGHLNLVESCSPNTNKPLHLGHIRNILLGDSIFRILEFSGTEVKRVQIINDRGIAICKSMLAWQKFGNGETPEDAGVKPDHFVGRYYVLFDQKFKEEYQSFQESEEGLQWYEANRKQEEEKPTFFKRVKNDYFNQKSEIGGEARQMLLDWEQNNEEVRKLWRLMNGWVYQGFEETYQKLHVGFDQLYYESEMYLKGRDEVFKALESGLFYRTEDGSVRVNLEAFGLDEKILLRADGTSLYITQDIGTAIQRYEDYKMDGMTYVVGNEQDYHFKVLFNVLKMMGHEFSDHLHHLSYGMVELPDGKMKSREGTVVDADDLIEEVIREAESGISERVSSLGLEDKGKNELAYKIGMAALKYFILKVNPKKGMVFDPSESVDLQGQTGPYIQYSYVRINGLIERAKKEELQWSGRMYSNRLQNQEKYILRLLAQFPAIVQDSAAEMDPSVVANYCYTLARAYHKLWSDIPILIAEEEEKLFRITLSEKTGKVIQRAMGLLGIAMPLKM